jgi:hypothetical protein
MDLDQLSNKSFASDNEEPYAGKTVPRIASQATNTPTPAATSHSTSSSTHLIDSGEAEKEEHEEVHPATITPFQNLIESQAAESNHTPQPSNSKSNKLQASKKESVKAKSKSTSYTSNTSSETKSKPPSQPTASKATKCDTSSKPQSSRPPNMPLYKYANSKPSNANETDWKNQYRSIDDSIYKSNAIGRWRAKSNALRQAGYTRKKAFLQWNNKHDPKYKIDQAYKKSKDIADKEALGDINDWLKRVDWDEEVEVVNWEAWKKEKNKNTGEDVVEDDEHEAEKDAKKKQQKKKKAKKSCQEGGDTEMKDADDEDEDGDEDPATARTRALLSLPRNPWDKEWGPRRLRGG